MATDCFIFSFFYTCSVGIGQLSTQALSQICETVFKIWMSNNLDQTSLLFSVASSNLRRHAFIASV